MFDFSYLPLIWQSFTYTLKVDSKDPSRKKRRQQLTTDDFSANLLVHLYLFYFSSVNGAILQLSRLHQKWLHIKIYLLLLYLNWSKVKHYAHLFFSNWFKRNWNFKTCGIDLNPLVICGFLFRWRTRIDDSYLKNGFKRL